MATVDSQLDLSACLTPDVDIAVDSHSLPKIMRVRIKQSKMDTVPGRRRYLSRSH